MTSLALALLLLALAGSWYAWTSDTLTLYEGLAARCAELQQRIAALEAIPTIVESPDGNPGWVEAKDAVKMLAEVRAQSDAFWELLDDVREFLRSDTQEYDQVRSLLKDIDSALAQKEQGK